MERTIYSLPLTLCLAWSVGLFSSAVFAHAEHDKARFVAQGGVDKGRCDSPVRACQSIAYAVQQANKGDKVLVADGHYAVQNAEDLFYLSSQLVPVLGGYNKYDHFQSQAPQLNPTILTGVPAAYIELMQQQGFVVVNDGFASGMAGLAELEQQQAQLQQSHGAMACVNGMAGTFPCKNIDLVSHLALADFSGKPTAANDIWGHVDLNTGTEYALVGLKNGTAVVSLANPEQPTEVGTINGSITSWRDIKVWQFFDKITLRWKAYAYVSSEGSDKIQIIDLSLLPNSIRLVSADDAATSAHNLYISNVDYTTNTSLDGMEPALHIVGQKTVGGAFTSYGLKNPEKLTAYYPHLGATRDDYTHDASSMLVTDTRASNDCKKLLCTLLMDFNEQSVRLWDISNLSTASILSDRTYTNARYIHSGWWTEDKRYVLVHDELDERDLGLNTTVRVLNIDSLTNPQWVKDWTGPSAAIDHNGYTRGNRYYMSNYQRGTTILDITDPTNPTEAGYFDSFPSSDGAAFNGVWGTYPYLPSGLILSSDINSGLYVLRDQTKNSAAGSVAFSQAKSQFAVGAPVTFTVKRPSGSGAVNVGYETLVGFGIAANTTLASGRINWANNDFADKTITISMPASGVDKHSMLFVKLFNPQNGATLGTPSYQTIQIGQAEPSIGSAGFLLGSVQAAENSGILTLTVGRFGGSSGELKVTYQTQNGTAKAGEDFEAASGQLIWADGDAASKTIQVQLLDDNLLESDETFTVQLTAVSGAVLPQNASITVLIKDNEVNRAPVVALIENQEVNAGQTVTIKALATDADGHAISYQWQQITGSAVALQNANTASLSFVAPNQSSTLSFMVTATDTLGATGTTIAHIIVKGTTAVEPPPVTPPPAANSGGSGGAWGGFSLMLLAGLWYRRLLGQQTLNKDKATKTKALSQA